MSERFIFVFELYMSIFFIATVKAIARAIEKWVATHKDD